MSPLKRNLLTLFVLVSCLFSLLSLFRPNELNRFGLSANPMVFSEEFFFVRSRLYCVTREKTAEIPMTDLFNAFVPVFIRRERYLVLLRFFKLDPITVNHALNAICKRDLASLKPIGLKLQVDLPSHRREYDYLCR